VSRGVKLYALFAIRGVIVIWVAVVFKSVVALKGMVAIKGVQLNAPTS
jgi:hypothetical protein